MVALEVCTQQDTEHLETLLHSAQSMQLAVVEVEQEQRMEVHILLNQV
jgi:hypothetical protein